jgi:hypothetical protein
MWPFARKPVVVALTTQIRSSLLADRGVSDEISSSLRMVEEKGKYSSRPVTYFRVYDPGNTKWGTTEPRNYAELQAGRILHSGHTEEDGRIVLNRNVIGI